MFLGTELGKLGETLARKILKEENFSGIHDNNVEYCLDLSKIWYWPTFDFYAEKEKERWVIDVKTSTSDNKISLTMDQVIVGYILARRNFRVGILKLNIEAKKYTLYDIRFILLSAVEEMFKEIHGRKEVKLSKLKEYAKKYYEEKLAAGSRKEQILNSINVVYKLKLRDFSELYEGIKVLEGKLRI